jgi:hypothetical protein
MSPFLSNSFHVRHPFCARPRSGTSPASGPDDDPERTDEQRDVVVTFTIKNPDPLVIGVDDPSSWQYLLPPKAQTFSVH